MLCRHVHHLTAGVSFVAYDWLQWYWCQSVPMQLAKGLV